MTPRTLELVNWTMEKKCQKVVEGLAKRGFKAQFCATGQEAATYILAQAQEAQNVGFGGSLSVADLDLTLVLAEQGKEIINHGFPNLTPEQKLVAMRRQLTCDLFLTGTNAVTLDGILVNIDGNGNRVNAMIFGPKKVIVVVGRNKIVEGSVEDALARIKEMASPPNAMRLSKQTPCAVTGICSNCDSPQRICRVTTILDRKPGLTDIHVLVINEDMGL
jgi:L-lactate utilization protein LutB